MGRVHCDCLVSRFQTLSSMSRLVGKVGAEREYIKAAANCSSGLSATSQTAKPDLAGKAKIGLPVVKLHSSADCSALPLVNSVLPSELNLNLVAVVGNEIRSIGRSQDFAEAGTEDAIGENLGCALIAPLGICCAIASPKTAQLTNPDNHATATIDFIGKV